MKIRTRLIINSVVALAMMLVMVLLFIQFRQQTFQSDQKLALVEEMGKTIFEKTTLRDEYLTHQSERARVLYLAKTERFRHLLEEAKSKFQMPSDRKILEEIEETLTETTLIFHKLSEMNAREKRSSKEPDLFEEAQKRLVSQILLKVNVLMDRIGSLRVSMKRESDTAHEELHFFFVIFAVLVVIVTIGNAIIINSLLAKRIGALQRGAEIMGEGNLDYHIDVPGNDELSGLAQTNNEMADKLKNSYTSLENLEQEISRRKQAEVDVRELNTQLEQRVSDRTAQLEASNKEFEAFSYSVSHDLRAPLRGIDGWSIALIEDYGEKLDGEAQKYLSRIRAETQQMGRIIDDMLKLAQVTRAEMRVVPIDLTAFAQRITARLQEEVPHRRIEFVIEPELKADGDEHLLDIALTNLFNNAVKFTGTQPDARIEFGTARVEGCPVFFVGDNGVGFDMAYASKLFGAFQRLHKSSEFPGTGIGLATVQRILSRHGGRVWVEAAVDKGATFFFTI